MKYTKEILQEAVKNSRSINGVLRYLGVTVNGGYNNYIKSRIKHYEIDISHFNQKRTKPSKKKHYSEILVNRDQDTREDTKRLRKALLEYGREYKCYKCGIHEWQGQLLVLQIHHKDEDFRNNTPENLEFVCPNCHIQMKGTYGRQTNEITWDFLLNDKHLYRYDKNKVPTSNCIECNGKCYRQAKLCRDCYKKQQRKQSSNITKTKLIEAFKKYKNFTQTAKHFHITDNAIRKWCKKYNLPTHTKDMIKYINGLQV